MMPPFRSAILTQKTRHIKRCFHFVHEGQEHDGIYQLHWISCKNQLADVLTNTQPANKIDPHFSKIFYVLPDHLLFPTSGA